MSKTCGSHTHTYRYAHLTKLKPQIHKRKPLNRTEWFWFLFLLSWKINFKLSHSLAMQDKIKEKFIKISISHTRSDDVSFKFSDRLNVNIICVDFIMCRGPIKIHWPINLKDDKKNAEFHSMHTISSEATHFWPVAVFFFHLLIRNDFHNKIPHSFETD